MTADRTAERTTRGQGRLLRFGGVPVHHRLMAGLPALTDGVLASLAESLPVYRLPAEQLDGDLRRETEGAIRAFIEVLRTGAPPTEAQLAQIRASAAQRAEEGVPVEAAVLAYHAGALACFDAVIPEAGPEDMADAAQVQRLLVEYLGRISAAISEGFLDEHRTALGERSAARQTLLSALLEGTEPGEEATRAGIVLPPAYLTVAMAVGRHPDERRADVDTTVATRRKLRRLRAELERRIGRSVLLRLSDNAALALIPCRVAPSALDVEDWEGLAELVAALAESCGAPILAAARECEPPGVPAAVRLARELRDLAVAAGLPCGVYRLEDLALEYQLSRPGPGRDHLAELLGPARDKPDLLLTLRAFLASGLNRRAAASHLGIHPNTVDYRLRKLATLTGLDPTTYAHALTLRASLIALDAGRPRAGDPGAEPQPEPA
ncbi:helix-turn-helix domain-containing protein [Streptomyces sp. DSM 44917]|uniref:Helix-turn-helix domain-containing protein n=1 Tax=Streptomyces boetiae TaxID=3075541 RepID=A0ABU2LDM8_9ACTN|nr:helix-turn-helix domain-containing protein [Streptomyces sp. DSM 44917]MDT0309596.1 helix-turn-helix domain-containing protein [Streptomyces sp. DSM 44917]